MRSASVYVMGERAGLLEESGQGQYVFRYLESYDGPHVSLTMPVGQREYSFDGFPPFFEGLLPEGDMFEGLLRQRKIDRADAFAQLVAVGGEMVGAVTVKEETS
ncbi:MAG: serine/threonine-protein kinase HipA [Candidatus Promineifilaceae bacterium]